MAYTVGVAAMLVAFWATPASLAWAQWVAVFMIGFFLYGPQMLIGLCGAELVGPESVGASEVRGPTPINDADSLIDVKGCRPGGGCLFPTPLGGPV